MKCCQRYWLCLMFILATGCAYWPPLGVGGMAEQRPTRLPDREPMPHRQNIEKIIAYKNKIENKIHIIRPLLQQCMPSRLVQLDQQRILIQRELHARLWYDTLYHLDRMDKNIRQTTKDLTLLQKKTGCGKLTGYKLTQWQSL